MNNNEQIKKLTKKDYEQFKNVLYVFKEAPWYENLTEEDVKSEWQLYEKSKIEKALEKDIIMPNDFYSVLGYFVDDQLVSMISYTLSYGNDNLHLEHGVDFNKENGELLYTKEGAHSTNRILFHDDVTGREITSKLLDRVKERAKADRAGISCRRT